MMVKFSGKLIVILSLLFFLLFNSVSVHFTLNKLIMFTDEELCTPAGFVGSLHLSNQAMLVPETTESEDPLPSTPEEFEGLPKIIPSSPTDGSFQG